MCSQHHNGPEAPTAPEGNRLPSADRESMVLKIHTTSAEGQGGSDLRQLHKFSGRKESSWAPILYL